MSGDGDSLWWWCTAVLLEQELLGQSVQNLTWAVRENDSHVMVRMVTHEKAMVLTKSISSSKTLIR
jgi:hypothetical protein